MGLSRQRQRELNRLKRQTKALLRDQREVLAHASKVVQAASRQASALGHEAYDDRIRPAVRRGRQRFAHDVVPAVTSALGSAIAVVESMRRPTHDALDRVSRSARELGERAGVIEPPKKSSPAKYIVLGVAAVAVAGVAYAAWQTLRADDSLWVEDEGADDLDEPGSL